MRQHGLEDRMGLGRRPEGRAIVDVEGHSRCLDERAFDERARRLAEGGRDPGEVHEPSAPYRIPIHLRRSEPGERRVAPIVEDPHRPRRYAVFEEVDADSRTVDHPHVAAVHAVTGQLAPDPLAPRVGRQGGDPRGAQAQAGARGGHVGLGAPDLQIELARCLEARGRRNRQPQQYLAERDEVVHLAGLQANLD